MAAPRDSADPLVLAGRYGTDAVRWWLLREVPRVGDADFTEARLVARANADLANDLGNLVSRVVTLVHRYRQGRVPRPGRPGEQPQGHDPAAGPGPGDQPLGAEHDGLTPAGRRLAVACDQGPERIAAALAAFDFRAATAAIWEVVEEANRYVERAEPWRLAGAERDGDAGAGRRLDASLALLVRACAGLGRDLGPFVPDLAARVQAAFDDATGRLPAARPIFPRVIKSAGQLPT